MMKKRRKKIKSTVVFLVMKTNEERIPVILKAWYVADKSLNLNLQPRSTYIDLAIKPKICLTDIITSLVQHPCTEPLCVELSHQNPLSF